jgi:hypothetical protein
MGGRRLQLNPGPLSIGRVRETPKPPITEADRAEVEALLRHRRDADHDRGVCPLCPEEEVK